MKRTEKAAVMRVLTDLIEADGIIDTRETIYLESLRGKYAIGREDEVLASSCTLATAFERLAGVDNSVRHDLLGDFTAMAMSDGIYPCEEALLILAIRMCLTMNTGFPATVVSVDAQGSAADFENSQIIYVEGEWDEATNRRR